MFEKKGFSLLKYLMIIFSAIILVKMYYDWNNFIPLFLIFVFTVIFFEIFRKEKNPLNPMILVFGLIYISLPFVILNEIIKLPGFNYVIYIFILIWTCDSAAYFGGRAFGKHQLSVISPKKTREGAVAGFIFTVIVSIIIHFIFPGKLNLTDAVYLGIIIGIFSQAGDLFESLIKRYCDVKDSSDIIPGHGGILDRFDSLFFVTPVIFIYFVYIR